MSVVKALCMLCVRGARERERGGGASPLLTACHSGLHARVSIGVEAESVRQMFANRPVDRLVPDLEGEEFYCPGKTPQLDFASN